MTTGELIRYYRKKRGLTQKQLGEKCGMADSAIRRYESDRGNPTIATLKRISGALYVYVFDIVPKEAWEKLGATEEMIDAVLADPILEIISESLTLLNFEGHLMAIKKVQDLTNDPKFQKYRQENIELEVSQKETPTESTEEQKEKAPEEDPKP